MAWEDAPPWAQTGEVETLDGFVLVFSPWAVRNIRFDESLSRFHGYDLDYCLQVREAGRKVVTADFRAIHHREIEMLPDPEEWIEAHINVAEKWDGRMPRVGTRAGQLARAGAARRGRARRRARHGAYEGARARRARSRAPARHRPRRARACRGGSPRRCAGAAADDRLRRPPSPTRRPTGASPSPASAAPASRTPRSTFRRGRNVCRSNNLLLDAAAAHEDLEALVIVDARHGDRRRRLLRAVREALRDPEVALAGPVGARGVARSPGGRAR